MLPAPLGKLEHACSAESGWSGLRTQEAGYWVEMGAGPSGRRLLLLRAFAVRDIGLTTGSLGILLGFTSVLLALRVVVLAMLLCCSAMRFRGDLVLLSRLGVRLLYHFSIFLLAGYPSAARSGANSVRMKCQWCRN
jgi:hypothetical protein